MGIAMTAPLLQLPLLQLPLRASLALRRFGLLRAGVVLLLLGASAGAVWLYLQIGQKHARHQTALATATREVPPLVRTVPRRDNALAHFFQNLGAGARVERQVDVLFSLAAKHGLTLTQGEYATAFHAASGVYTYQITLPVKGSFQAVRDFSLAYLRAVPFASLDEISIKRETIGEPFIEANVRLTLYLRSTPGGAP